MQSDSVISGLHGKVITTLAEYCLPLIPISAVLVFEFDPEVYESSEDAVDVDLSVSLAEGDVGEFSIVLTAATDDNNTNATATG